MMNLSLLFKNKQLLYFLFIGLCAALYMLYLSMFIAAALLFAFVLLGVFVPSKTQSSRDDELLVEMREVIAKAGEGQLEGRVTNIPTDSNYFDIAWGYNNLVDQVETFIRDTLSAINLAAQGDRSAHIYEHGLKGSFAHSIEPLNIALDGIVAGKILEAQGSLSRSFDKLGGGTTGGMYDIKKDIENREGRDTLFASKS